MDQQTPTEGLRGVSPVRANGYGKRLSKAAQVTLLLLMTAGLLGVLLGHPAGLPRLGLSELNNQLPATPQTRKTGAFEVTQRQWGTLKVQPVEMRVFRDITETDGRIAIDDDLVTPIFSAYSGRITKLMAHAGDTVAAGAPLFAIQATELAQGQNDLITAGSNVKTAKAQLALATTNERRQHDLYSAQGTSLKDWQQAQFDLVTAQGGVSTSSIVLAAVRNRLRILGKSDAEISEIEAAPDILRLAVEAVVTAPIGGTVVQRQVGLGQNIVSASSGASTPVFLIGDLSKVWLVANVREEDAPRSHNGAAVEVSVLAFPDETFHARLSYVGTAIDPITRRLPVRAEIDNVDGRLKPDMFASFRIITGDERLSAAVPEIAVVHEAESAHVWVANPEDRTLELRPIRTGRTHDGLVEVREGLKPDERIVTSGAVFIDRAATGD